MSVAKSVNVNYNTWCLSATHTHVYAYYFHQLCVYDYELVLIKQVGQQNNPTGPFYFLTGIKQLEVNKGKIYFLNCRNLQILKEDSGELVKSVAVDADNITFDSEDNVVLINNATQEITTLKKMVALWNKYQSNATQLDLKHL